MTYPWFAFSSRIIFRVSGKDARRYLHNRLSQDLRECTPESPVKAAALTAQGRVEGLFVVLCGAGDTFYLACDGGKRTSILSALSRFIVADQVSVEDYSQEATWCHVACEPSELPSPLCLVLGAKQVFMYPHRRIGAAGTDILILTQSRGESTFRLNELLGPPISESMYNTLRFKYGVASYPLEINEEMILTECPARDAVSFTKGCYVGQEVLERGDALGKLPRLLERIVFPPSEETLRVGDTIAALDGTTIGKVTSVTVEEDGQQILVFALLRNGKYNYGDSVTCQSLTGCIIPQQAVLS